MQTIGQTLFWYYDHNCMRKNKGGVGTLRNDSFNKMTPMYVGKGGVCIGNS